MKKLSINLLAGVAVLVAGLGAASAQEVRVGIAAEPYPPFTSPDASGNWTGWEIDFINAMCEEAGLDCVIPPLSWDGIIPALTTNRIDMIINSMSITPERLQTIDFSDRYYNTPTIVIGDRNLDFEATPEGLADKVIGVQVATMHQAYAQKHFVPAGATIREYQTQDEATNDLAAGRVDAVQADSVGLADFLASDAGQACCETKGSVAQDEEILGPGVGVGLRKGDTELKERVNAAIAAIRADGTYDEFTRQYFDFDIYGE